MSFIIIVRNPLFKKLVVIIDSDDCPMEFDTKEAAENCANCLEVCQSWGYQIIEIE